MKYWQKCGAKQDIPLVTPTSQIVGTLAEFNADQVRRLSQMPSNILKEGTDSTAPFNKGTGSGAG
jgi:hypothetical protein